MLDQITDEHHRKIRAGFIMQGTSLGAWCAQNGVKHQNAIKALKGKWTGPKARDLVRRIIEASGGAGMAGVRVTSLLGIGSIPRRPSG